MLLLCLKPPAAPSCPKGKCELLESRPFVISTFCLCSTDPCPVCAPCNSAILCSDVGNHRICICQGLQRKRTNWLYIYKKREIFFKGIGRHVIVECDKSEICRAGWRPKKELILQLESKGYREAESPSSSELLPLTEWM